jgi:hypothetical protein
MKQYHLDFGKAFQYFTAERNKLRIGCFDADFDRAPERRLTPGQALEEIQRAAAP